MNQPFLDLTNYENPTCPGDFGDMQSFLCRAPKTDGRFGFMPGGRVHDSGFVYAALTPYGMQVLEGHYVKLFSIFGELNYKIVKRLCESPLPDASIINLLDNAVRIRHEQEPGEPTQYTMTQVGFINPYSRKEGWTSCGCDCLIEWDGQCKFLSLEVASLLRTTGRLTVIPIEERMCPRHGAMHDLKYTPHPNPVTWTGKPITEEMILADIERYNKK